MGWWADRDVKCVTTNASFSQGPLGEIGPPGQQGNPGLQVFKNFQLKWPYSSYRFHLLMLHIYSCINTFACCTQTVFSSHFTFVFTFSPTSFYSYLVCTIQNYDTHSKYKAISSRFCRYRVHTPTITYSFLLFLTLYLIDALFWFRACLVLRVPLDCQERR